jgi:hypothetical protein
VLALHKLGARSRQRPIVIKNLCRHCPSLTQ